ncbi:MAG: hypothetical protein IPM93_28425 [Candidatus Obscuribacter sp.]|nr:hypothetical protein [Candidatus Obscuribacter sp.]
MCVEEISEKRSKESLKLAGAGNTKQLQSQRSARVRARLTSLALTLAVLSNCSLALLAPTAALAASSKSKPDSTLLLPLTPKIDDTALTDDEKELPSQVKSTGSQAQPQRQPSPSKSEPSSSLPTDAGEINELKVEQPKLDDLETTELKEQTTRITAEGADASTRLEAEASEDDLRMSETDSAVNEDTTLKGTIQIVADDTEYDQEKNTFLGTGNAVAVIGGQNSKLEADMILYDQNTQMIDARGNVKILRDGQLTTGSAFKFNVTNDEYLITSPDTEVKGTQVIARTGYGTREGMSFKNGTMTLPKAFHMGKNVMFGTLSTGQDLMDRTSHPDLFLGKQSYTFKARKMVYERYKESGNLTVFGGKICFGKFNIPVPKFVTTVGTETNVRFPVSPMFTSNIQSGGINIGPSFNTAVGKTGVLNWAPMIQLGGRSTTGSTNGSGLGLSGQVGFSNKKFSSHIAYGSVSNLFVADFKTNLSKNTVLQAGVNRYMADGINGFRRPNMILEVVNNKYVSSPIPYITGFNFRSSGGWARDNPQLINTSPALADLYGGTTTVKTQPSAFRLQEQISVTTQPLFAIGNEKYGTKGFFYGGLGLSAYSSGDARALLQGGPSIDTRLNRLHFQVGYTQSAVRGSSPFYFDRFIQGQKSMYISGDVKVSKWLTLGGGYGYNLNAKLPYAKTISAVIGPEDLKLMITRDMIRGQNRVGFDVLYGSPIPFNKLVLKGTADHGNLSGL